MSTAPNPIVKAPHPAWYARAGTFFLKVGRAVKSAIQKIAGDMPAVQAEIAKVAPTAEALSEMVLKGSSTFEAHLLDVWGVAANAVKDAGAAADANGISVVLDQNLIRDIRGFLPQVENYLHPSASPAPPPAGS
jgi:hypothetical protein